VLRPSGVLLLNLPAWEWLRGAHDVSQRTARRYTRPEVRRLLVDAGFVIQRLTYWNATLLPLLAVWRPISRLRGCDQADFRPLPRALNTWLTRIVQAEGRLGRRMAIPFGSSLFAVASKPA
jgi:hypothetical protein